jgi:DNA-binding MarR family transcriptional regulator
MTSSSDPVEAIVAALARLKGRRMPRPPWAEGPHAHGWAHGGPHSDAHHHGRGHGPWGGPPPWAGGGPGAGRFGGPARLRLLEALAAASEPLTVGEIADAIGVDQPRASRLVQQSVELGLVRREADPDDARRTRIVLTDEGKAIARGFRGERREAVAQALADFTEAERAELARLLSKLADAWPRG